MTNDLQHKSKGQLLWGIALILVGVGVFFRIPQVMPKLAEMAYFTSVMGFIRFCLYLMGVILIGGGVKKILAYTRAESAGSVDSDHGNHSD